MTGGETLDEAIRRFVESPRGHYEWDQANDPLMINKTIPSIVNNMTGLPCSDEYIDGWGSRHLCIRAVGHTGRHYDVNWGGHYVTAVWK